MMIIIMMMMVVIGMMMMMVKINFLSGMMGIKDERLKKLQLKKGSYPLLGIHQGGGIGACQRTKRKRQKNCEHETWTFLCLVTGYKNLLSKKN